MMTFSATDHNVSASPRMPSLFLSHGSPMMAVEHSETTEFFTNLGRVIEKPQAVILFSAHFDESDKVVVTGANQLATIHDFYGFPKPLYQIQYPAIGLPSLAKQVVDMLSIGGIDSSIDGTRGLDHGAWVPMRYLFPELDVPVISVSINSQASASFHYQLGKMLRPLRDQGVLFIGSGGISHNLREIFSPTPDPQRVTKVNEFVDWIGQCLAERDVESILNYLNVAPHARFNHPTPDHFLPLPMILGTSFDDEVGVTLHKAVDLDILALDAYGFGL
jgi:4,5-DOPA dioxygenase extradiol